MTVRVILALAALVVVGTGAQAADAPLAGNYGTEAGCAAEAGRAAAAGESIVVTPQLVRYDGMICPVTGVSEVGPQSWELAIVCARGHDDEFPGKIRVVETPGQSMSVELVSGEGPAGDFAACTP